MPTNIRPIPNNDDRASANYGKTRHHAFHKRGRAGVKLLRSFFKAKHGTKPESPQEAAAWYAQRAEPKYRAGESKKRIAALEAAAA